jgi:uncharacterized protein (TIGR03067 family)
MTMLTTMAMVLALAGAQTTPKPPAVTGAQAIASLQGTWDVTSINGQVLADGGMTMQITFTGEKYAQMVNGQVNERGTYKIDAAKKPHTFDLTIVEGDDAGKVQPGIIEITGDTFKGHLAAPGGTDRPADFTMKQGNILFLAKKVK